MTKLNKRILSALLAFVLLMTNFPVISSASDSFAIHYEGKAVTEVEFYEHERITVTAEGNPGDACQWQIQIPGTEQWVNIQGQTAQTINLSKAVVGSLMVDGSAHVRCAAIRDGETVEYTAALRTTVKTEEPVSQTPAVPAVTVPAPAPTEAPVEATEAPAEATEPIVEVTEAPDEAITAPIEISTEMLEIFGMTAASAQPEAEAVVAAPVEEPIAATEAPTEPVTVPEIPVETAAPTEPEAEAVATAPAEEPAVEATEPAEEKTAQTFVEKVVQMFAPKTNADGDSTDETEAAEASDDVDVSVVTVAIHYRAVDRLNKFEKPYVSDDETDTTDYADATSADNAAKADEVIDPYEAHIVSGSDLNVTIPCHVIPGYELVIPSFYEGANNPGIAVNGTNLTVNLTGVSQNTDLYVYYRETTVSYTARYFIQNVYNDLYTEDTSILTTEIQLQMKGFPGDEPDENVIYPTVYGFTALFFQPDTIASDGSTVFEVYYDRNYYLMNFNMDGGYGTAPVYARYGTAFTVAQPTKSGYTFNGWKEDESKRAVNADGSTETDSAFVAALETHIDGIDKLNGRVTKIPFSNLTYTAQWTQQSTTYKVAYWILDDAGNKTYIGSDIRRADSGTEVDGKDNLDEIDSEGNPVTDRARICGYEEHTHVDSCYTCNSSEHTHHEAHSRDCYSYVTSWNEEVGQEDRNVIATANAQHTDISGTYIYVISSTWSSALWPKILIDDKYYTVNINGSLTISQTLLDSITIGEELANVSNGSLYASKYRLRPDCELTVCEADCSITVHTHDASCLVCGNDTHTHSNSCYLCGQTTHTHSTTCYQDTTYLDYVEEATFTDEEGKEFEIKTDKDKIVEGDGSTVVNVYYQYRKYRLKFYYAAADGNTTNATDVTYRVIGGSTYYFGGQHQTGANYNNYINSSTFDMLNRVFTAGVSGQVASTSTPSLKQSVINEGIYDTGCDYDETYNRTYYYISFTARYNDNIASKWPADVFNSITMASGSYNSSFGSTATVSAWNGEHHVWYSRHNGNETIKGVYEKLDSKILYDSSLYTTYPESTDSMGNNPLPTVSYLCFWQNGANVGWSIPELYIYNIWLPYTGNSFDTLPEDEKKVFDGKNYYLHDSYNVCDDSLVSKQTVPALTGYTYNEKDKESNWGVIFISDATNPSGSTYSGPGEKDESRITYDSSTNTATDASGWKSNQQTLTITTQDDGRYLLHSSDYETKYKSNTLNESVYREAYYRDFYYTPNGPHTLNFWNVNDYMVDGNGEQFYYGASLSKFKASDNNTFMTKGYTYDGVTYGPYYPKTLEPDAYTFAGWYTSSECYDDTRVNWETMTMPDADLTVYAKWVPVKYRTYFYMDYERYEQKKHYATVEDTPHGENMVLDGFDPKPTFVDAAGEPNSNYRFVGWFYIDTDGTKKAFNPSEMAVRKELHLFAEWTTSIVQEYEVSYAHGVWSESEGKYVAASPACTMAADSTGYALEATTKTFTALPKNKLTNFPDGTENLLWLPHTNSHSIVMRATQTQEVDGETVTVNPNVYTFYYIKATEVSYTVRYLDAATGASVREDNTTTLTAGMVTAGVITEPFAYVAGYIPDAFHKRLVLSADASENVIVFYYTKDEAADDDVGTGGDVTRQRYLVVHHFPGLTETDEEVTVEDTDIGDVNAKVTVDEMENPGFEFDEEKTKEQYIERFGSSLTTDAEKEALADKNVVQTDGTWKVSGTVTSGADNAANKPLELHLYYKRVAYGYKVIHKDRESNKVLETVEMDPVPFETAVSVKSEGRAGYDLYGADSDGTKTLSLKIGANAETNVITFYYIKKKVKVSYIPICTDSAITDGFGIVTNPMDYDKTQDTLTGSEASAESGFHFLGWYQDQYSETEVPVTTQTRIQGEDIKLTSDVYDYTYYAVFEPITLTISQTNMNATDSAVYEIVQGSNVIARVMLTGDDFVTLQAIPVGTYTVREVSRTDDGTTYDWTWTYGDPTATPAEGQITVVAGADNVVTFTHSADTVDWLHSETHR